MNAQWQANYEEYRQLQLHLVRQRVSAHPLWLPTGAIFNADDITHSFSAIIYKEASLETQGQHHHFDLAPIISSHAGATNHNAYAIKLVCVSTKNFVSFYMLTSMPFGFFFTKLTYVHTFFSRLVKK